MVLRNDVFVSELYDPTTTGTPPPPQMQFQCIWDTGATHTVITSNVVAALGLKPSGKATVQVVGQGSKAQIHETDTFLVNLILPNHVGLSGIRVSLGSLGGSDVLIGMDVISLGDFAVTNWNGKTCWSFRFPSVAEIDFVKESKMQPSNTGRNDPCPCGSGKKYKKCHGR